MNSKTFLWLFIAVIIILGFIILASDRTQSIDPVNGNNNENDEVNEVDLLLNRLPYQTAIDGKTIVFDTTSVPMTGRNEYSEKKDVIEITIDPGEDPIQFIERYLEEQISQQHIQEQSEFFDFTVSFHRPNGGQGVYVFVRVMNIPDDSVGGGEGRFEFIFENNLWSLDWYGERVFCRRPGQEFWQPVDELCP